MKVIQCKCSNNSS